jgi:hypothetical protein
MGTVSSHGSKRTTRARCAATSCQRRARSTRLEGAGWGKGLSWEEEEEAEEEEAEEEEEEEEEEALSGIQPCLLLKT